MLGGGSIVSAKTPAFVKQSIKHMSAFLHKKQFNIKPISKTFNEIEDYERHVCRNGWKQVYRDGEKRRNRR